MHFFIHMHCLSTIIAMNERAAAKAVSRNTNHLDREPSCCRSRSGLVLHSATLRSTVFFDSENPAAERDAKRVEAAFRRYAKTRNLKALNLFVDSFFV
ncbi:MAG: hypothetical protein EBR82_32090 [Caulobacteraceae bacterium]|nr:hypothetical protein [Caulobacteraceae bacterium]